MIAAAGLGSRLGHGLPKCMLEIEGRTILSRLLETVSLQTDRIHVVVGYREELVIDYCATHHRDVVIVRNPDFRTTNTITSMAMGSRGLSGQLLFVDGDTVIEHSSLAAFVAAGQSSEILVGVAPARSDDSVYVTLTNREEGPLRVTAFHRDQPSDYEWANILLAPQRVIAEKTGYVFEALEPLLPLPVTEVNLAEVDTEQDLARANAVVSAWERHAG